MTGTGNGNGHGTGPGTGLPPNIGPYRPIRLLGEGGMGSVYEAVHESTSRRVAVKVLLPEYARDPTMTARFFNKRPPEGSSPCGNWQGKAARLPLGLCR